MIYKPGDLPDFKYVSESLMPRVIGCTGVYLFTGQVYLCVEGYRYGNSFFIGVDMENSYKYFNTGGKEK